MAAAGSLVGHLLYGGVLGVIAGEAAVPAARLSSARA